MADRQRSFPCNSGGVALVVLYENPQTFSGFRRACGVLIGTRGLRPNDDRNHGRSLALWPA